MFKLVVKKLDKKNQLKNIVWTAKMVSNKFVLLYWLQTM